MGQASFCSVLRECSEAQRVQVNSEECIRCTTQRYGSLHTKYRTQVDDEYGESSIRSQNAPL